MNRIAARWIVVSLLMVTATAARAQDATEPAANEATTSAATQPVGAADIIELSQKRFSAMKMDDIWNVNFWTGYVQDAIVWLIGFIPRLLVAAFLLLFFWAVYRGVRKVILGGMKAAGVDDSIRDMLGMLLKWFILGFALIIAGNQVGIQIAALLTGVSIIGLALGFAAQESISNFIAGIMIFWDKPFKIGDWIEIDDHLGQVVRVTFRSTRLQDLDGDIVVFPNTAMLNNKLINKTTNLVTRCNVDVGIAYKESIEHAREVMLKLVNSDPRIEKRPEAEVVVRSLGASSVDLTLHFWIKEERYEDAMQYEYMERVKKALDEAGIQIPFPHLQVFMEDTPAVGVLAGRK
ncbi:MAG TPA: mechanosensitive ion channel family protein [Tepidisphaeraceae bacterium]|nr:mechanosensitive ion channel family protein [Tepidisphaeraceae bacterium]